jgi:hypothetical protein
MSYSDNTQPEQGRLGEIEFQWKGGGTPAVKFDRIAHSGRRELLMVSLIADGMRLKQLRAALCGTEKSRENTTATADGIKTNQPGNEHYYASVPGYLKLSPDGYQMFQHKLGYGMSHAMFISRTPGFMMVVTPESLWRELNSTRFTTPILREWMPYLDRELRACQKLEDAHVFNCKCGLLTATTSALDKIVIDGLAKGKIHITPETATATAVA